MFVYWFLQPFCAPDHAHAVNVYSVLVGYWTSEGEGGGEKGEGGEGWHKAK